jgi:hypothetical protein
LLCYARLRERKFTSVGIGEPRQMSQVRTTQTTPKTLTSPGASRGARLKTRVEGFLRTFEWTWTSAVVFALGFTFFILISTSVLPSFWLYFADQTLRWDGGSAQTVLFFELPGGLLLVIRDAVAMGLATGPIITVLIVASILQNWRRKLRGQTDSRPTGGYR